MDNAINNSAITTTSQYDIGRIDVNDWLIKLFLFFLPFSQALSINILFPLKLSEIFLILWVIFNVITGKLLHKKLSKPIFITCFAFVVIVFVSVVINAFYKYPYKLDLSNSRIDPLVDSVLKFIYIVLAFAAMFLTYSAFKDNERYIKYFFWGAVAASMYAWYLFVSGLLRLPVFLLPGMEPDPQKGFGNIIIRAGTFKEGNYMGFYLFISGVLAIYYKKTRLAILFFLTIITAFSTTAIFCSFLFLLIFIYQKYKQYKRKLFLGMISIVVLLAVLINFSDGFKKIFYNKIFGTADTVEDRNDIYSKTERLNFTLVALEMAWDNPFLGVGAANFSLHYNHYNQIAIFDRNAKTIPNNIYVEILSEYGGLAFITFFVFIYFVFKKANKKSSDILVAGLLSSLIYFFAFPALTMLFIWVFIGVLIV
ncbi:O-antigen ligase family protein [Mucilaginibacter sp. AW1-3]